MYRAAADQNGKSLTFGFGQDVGKDVVFVMLTACFDASGNYQDPKQPFFVVAGFISRADRWIKFDEEWRKRLASDGLSYFHAVDFAASQKEFAVGWRDNEKRRRQLLEDLLDIIRQIHLGG